MTAPLDGRDLTDEIIRSYLRRMPGAEFAFVRDSLARREMELARSLLTLVDLGLQDEGVDEATRARVLRSALYGSLEDPAAAVERVHAAEKRTDELRRTVMSNAFTEAQLNRTGVRR